MTPMPTCCGIWSDGCTLGALNFFICKMGVIAPIQKALMVIRGSQHSDAQRAQWDTVALGKGKRHLKGSYPRQPRGKRGLGVAW